MYASAPEWWCARHQFTADTDFLHGMQHANVQILQAKYKQTGLISKVLAIIIDTLVILSVKHPE